jgi:hypothetical protein
MILSPNKCVHGVSNLAIPLDLNQDFRIEMCRGALHPTHYS